MLHPPPPEQVLPSGSTPVDVSPKRRVSRLVAALAVVASVIGLAAVAGFVIELPYFTISPGSSIDVNQRVQVDGAQTYDPEGELRLLFVRQRSNINVWEWVQASIDPDIDLVREQEFTHGQSNEQVEVGADADMARAQIHAKKVALESAGYEVPAGQGLVVLAVLPSRPAAEALQVGDVLLSVDGQPLVETQDLGEIVRQHTAGDVLEVVVERDGKERTERVGVELDDQGTPMIGVYPERLYDFPVEVAIDTSNIGGPSAGLAMTLSIIDTLTEGELTGGQTVAITGTIADDGSVGEIGALGQKAVAARAADADLFIVPKCADDAPTSPCQKDLVRARDRAGDLQIVPVATLDEALRALENAGGDPLQLAG